MKGGAILWGLFVCISWAVTSCSQIGYVPLTDVEVDKGLQREVRDTRKFMKKNVQPSNSQLPGSEKLLEKDVQPTNSQLPSSDKLLKKGIRKKRTAPPKTDKLLTMKKPSKRREKKAYRKRLAKQNKLQRAPKNKN